MTPVHDVVGLPGVYATFRTRLRDATELRVMNLGDLLATVWVCPVVEGGGYCHDFYIDPSAARRIVPEDFPGLIEYGNVGKLATFEVRSDQNVAVMHFIQSTAGDVSNLSRQPRTQLRNWFFPANNPLLAGVIEVVNRSEEAGAVAVHATDDAGRRRGPVTFELLPNAHVRFDSADLEDGNPAKGLNGSLGDGTGDWRVEVSSDLAIDVLTYVRRADGLLTPVHGAAPRVGHSHRIPFFNPGSNRRKASVLRLINPGDEEAQVRVSGRDDRGLPGGEVRLSLLPGTARNIPARELESGAVGLSGSLGDGAGKWRLTIDADRPLEAVALLGEPAGHLSNVSSTPAGRRFTKPLERHNVMLRVVRVTPDWMPFSDTGGWTQAAPTKESAHLRYFEAAIWDETGEIVLYEFPNDYDTAYINRAELNGVPEARREAMGAAYREQFRLAEFPVPDPEEDRSPALLDAFKAIAEILVARFPDSAHHLNYNGHGAPGGLLFEYQMSVAHANELFEHWTALLGSPLGVIDMGGPCNKGSLEDLRSFCPHAAFYIASDLPNGGWGSSHGGATVEEFQKTDWDEQYPRLFGEHADLQTVLAERVHLRRIHYELERESMIHTKTEQANYLYSCAAALDFIERFDRFQANLPQEHDRVYDLYLHLERNDAPESLIQGFRDVIAYGVDNRDFFEWEVDANGIACVACSRD